MWQVPEQRLPFVYWWGAFLNGNRGSERHWSSNHDCGLQTAVAVCEWRLFANRV
jgi:hypothetical protein